MATVKSRGRANGSGTLETENGTIKAHRCEQVNISTNPDGTLKIEDPYACFCVESLNTETLQGQGWIWENCALNIHGSPKQRKPGCYIVTFVGRHEGEYTRLDSKEASCFWLEIEQKL